MASDPRFESGSDLIDERLGVVDPRHLLVAGESAKLSQRGMRADRMTFHLLAVDDEADFRASLAMLFELEGFKVTLASHGEEALSLFDAGLQPHVVLLDQRMPGLSGTEVLQRLRKKGRSTPAILVSAMRDADKLAAEYGFEGCVRKPCGLDELVQTVRRLLPESAEGI